MTVICSESNPFMLCYLRKQVRRVLPEADIFICRTSKQVKQTAREKGCDILITEIDLGVLKGEGIILAQEIKKLNPRVNIIFAIAGLESEFATQMLKLKISGFLVKPFSKEELKEELVNLRYPKGGMKYEDTLCGDRG